MDSKVNLDISRVLDMPSSSTFILAGDKKEPQEDASQLLMRELGVRSRREQQHKVEEFLVGIAPLPEERRQEIHQNLKTLLLSLATWDLYTFQHSARVSALAQQLSHDLCPYEPAFTRRVYTASLLHDVGKIDIPQAILGKSGPLTDAERDRVQLHPCLSAGMLTSQLDSKTVSMVLSHHEHIDGRGYPDGLRGESIPFGSRIIAVADAYDAMTSTRPYRDAMKPERALNILQAGAGTQWDDEVIGSLRSLVSTNPYFVASGSIYSAHRV